VSAGGDKTNTWVAAFHWREGCTDDDSRSCTPPLGVPPVVTGAHSPPLPLLLACCYCQVPSRSHLFPQGMPRRACVPQPGARRRRCGKDHGLQAVGRQARRQGRGWLAQAPLSSRTFSQCLPMTLCLCETLSLPGAPRRPRSSSLSPLALACGKMNFALLHQVMIVDTSEPESVKEFAKNARAKLSHIDILVNNAGVMVGGSPH
jgi:hypothetical protein